VGCDVVGTVVGTEVGMEVVGVLVGDWLSLVRGARHGHQQLGNALVTWGGRSLRVVVSRGGASPVGAQLGS
jgi:hypothetical protein